MSFSFRRRIQICPGIHLNLSKTGAGFSFGKPGASISLGSKGIGMSVGVPGTGMYMRKYATGKSKERKGRRSKKHSLPLSFKYNEELLTPEESLETARLNSAEEDVERVAKEMQQVKCRRADSLIHIGWSWILLAATYIVSSESRILLSLQSVLALGHLLLCIQRHWYWLSLKNKHQKLSSKFEALKAA